MASTYSDLKVELIGTGEQTGTWGTTTNNNLSVALGEAITGSADVSFSSADVTVTLTDTNAAQTARNLRLNLTGTSGGARNLILGSGCQIEKLYLINNGLADAVTVKNTTGTGIAVPAGKTMFVYNNGTNVVEAVNSAVTLETTQVNITGQGDLRLEDTSGGEYVALQAPATLSSSYTLTLPVDDGSNGQALITDGNGVLSWSTAASGDVYGPASATDNAIARFDLTTGKLIQNSSALVDDSGNVLAGAGTVSVPAFSTTGDTNTGIFFPAADTIAFTEGGAESMRIDSSGNIGQGTTTPTVPNGTTADNPLNGIVNTIYGSSPAINLVASSGTGWSLLNFGRTGTTTSPYRSVIGYDQTNDLLVVSSQNVITFKTDAAVDSATERMRIDASGNVVVGNTSALTTAAGRGNITINGSSTSILVLGTGGATKGYLFHGGTDLTLQNSANGALAFATNSTERMRIDSSGNVGIGTSSPNAFTKLHVSGALRVADSTNAANYITIASGNEAPAGGNSVLSETSSMVLGTKANNICLLYTNNTERMRIDSSGEVLVGGTTAITSDTGVLTIQRAGAVQLNLFRDDTSVVSTNFLGEINFYGNDTTSNTPTRLAYVSAVASGDHAAGDNPTDLVFGTTADGSATVTARMRIDSSGNVLVGITSARANAGDVQVSKGISFPATQSAQSDANTLDDYEEGDWTPVLAGSSGTSGQSYSRQKGKYTKVGRLVTCTFDVVLTAVGTVSGEARITGLPFTVASDEGFRSGLSVGEFSNLAANYVQFGGVPLNSTTQIYIRALTAAAATSTAPNATSAWTNTTQVMGTFSYFV